MRMRLLINDDEVTARRHHFLPPKNELENSIRRNGFTRRGVTILSESQLYSYLQ